MVFLMYRFYRNFKPQKLQKASKETSNIKLKKRKIAKKVQVER